ncbi:GerAB/ArcD/ProY family transporter [Paenibacillus sacheonensis]|uniref:Endospore germination permease n=1 Tax=Paenibacillus sacheonensis TaxID=742054 RepID=A0A7X5BYI0_9BACL|nr:endospore germination permease [Paenibacillus sacheonensis]MBM7566961.1 spore germination protein KB [Paenibacillus sacheonensis]NBC71583.1 endospore germination permease [Paenibacillus sacheonensis]
MKEMRIGGKQLFWLVAVMQAGMTILLTINPAVMAAGRDAWLSTAFASLLGVFSAFVHARVNRRFPGQTLVDFVPSIVGKWAGNAVIGLYFLFWYVVLGMILRQYTEFILSTILPRTPLLVPLVSMILVAAYVTVSGIEVLARCSELFGPFILLGILLPLILMVDDAKMNYALPIYSDSGLLVILKGSLPTMTFLGDCVLMWMVYGFVAEQRTGSKYVLLGVGMSGLLTCAATFLSIVVMGPEQSSNMTYPYFNLIRNTSYFDFVQNMDSLVIAIWIVSVFIKVSLYFFACTYGTAQWLKVRRWRRMAWFVAPAALGIALVPRDFIESSVLFPQKIATPYILPIHMFGLPLLLWAVAKMRRAGEQPVKRKN